jgi:group II intron reverse transcriptase/maturase
MDSENRKWYSLYDKVYAKENLIEAWKKVKANKGKPGYDGESIAQFAKDEMRNLAEIQRLLMEKRYAPPPVLRVHIPKEVDATGRVVKTRPLGIPTVRDRIIQMATVQVIGPIFDADFCDCSYGFRPMHNQHQAIAKIREYYDQGYRWVVDADLQDFFGTLDHELLMGFVRERIVDGSVLRLIRLWLKAGVMEDMELKLVTTGSPQGGVISPLLSNIYLHQFDRMMTERGYRLVRYADDWVILCKLERKAERALEVAKQILEGQLKLKIHPEKTRIVDFKEGFDFLGCRFRFRYVTPKLKSLLKLKERVRQITARHRGKNLRQVLQELAPVIRGWGIYHRRYNNKTRFKQLDEWIRMRLRCFIEKKKAVKHQNRRIPSKWLEAQGHVTLCSLLA